MNGQMSVKDEIDSMFDSKKGAQYFCAGNHRPDFGQGQIFYMLASKNAYEMVFYD